MISISADSPMRMALLWSLVLLQVSPSNGLKEFFPNHHHLMKDTFLNAALEKSKNAVYK